MKAFKGIQKLSLLVALSLMMACTENPLSGSSSSEVSNDNGLTDDQTVLEANLPVLSEQDSFFVLGGDILLSKNDSAYTELIADLQSDASSDALSKSSGFRYMSVASWPNKKVPYRLSGFTAAETKVVRSAMDSLQKACGIQFVVAPTTQKLGVYTITRVRSTSYGGMSTLGYSSYPYCYLAEVSWGVAVHEFMHALGLLHEHQRYDRDKFVTIYTSNATSAYASQFAVVPHNVSWTDPATKKVVTSEQSRVYGTYDYASIMHYPTWAFSKNGKATIVPKVAGKTIGQRTKLSPVDKSTLVALYGVAVKTAK